MKLTVQGLVSSTIAALIGGSLLVATPAHAAEPVTINLIGINDFHGRIDADTLKWASTVEQVKADGGGDANSLIVSAGDNVGASVFASAIQGDVPTIDVLNTIGLDATAVGNHEFDQGYADLTDRIIPKADFDILGANVRKADGSRALPAYKIYTVSGVKIAVVGAVTQQTPTLVSPDRVNGLTFGDPSDSINEAVAEIKALPAAEQPDVTVASFHEGAPDGTATLQQALESDAVFRKLVNNTSADVDAIFMGHTHQKYVYDAPIPGQSGKTRPIVQTGQYGENVGQIKLSVDTDTDAVTASVARTVARSTDLDPAIITKYPHLSAIKTIRDDAVAYAAKEGNVEKGRITADLTRALTPAGAEDRASESTLGNTVADALLYRVGKTASGADIGLVNPGGLRTELRFAGVSGDAVNKDGVVTRAELNTVLPFANNLNTVAVSGAVLKEILEQQWQTAGPGEPTPTRAYLQLGVSKNVNFTYDDTRPSGDRITSVRIKGEALDLAKTYKIATFSFLAAGGDNFRAFRKGVSTDTALVDRDGWETFFADNSPVSPDFAKRTVQARVVKDAYVVGDSVSIALSKLDLTSTGSPANTAVTGTLTAGSSTVDLGSFPVTAGAATVAFDLPATVAGNATLTVKAAPSGTTVSVPLNVKAKSTTTSSAPSRAKVGTVFTVDTTVASSAGLVPTGTVTIKEGDTTLASGPLKDGKASVAIGASALSIDEHALTVSYSGDGSHAASTAPATTIDILKGASNLKAGTASGTYGQPTTVTVSTDPGASGLVYVTQAGRVVGLGFVRNGAGTMQLDGTALAPGSHTLDVAFGGSEKFEPSSTTTSVTIAKGASTVKKVSVAPTKIVRNRTKAWVTMSVAGKSFTVDGGKVTLRQGGKNYSGTVKNGKVRIRLGKFTTSGSAKKVTATYNGNGVANGSKISFTVKVAKK